MDHLQLVSEAKSAVDRVNGDTSVDQATTLESLQEIRGELDAQIEALQDSMAEQDGS